MSNEAITRLVVGDRYALSLGRPVEQRVRTNSTSALIWKNGEWVAAGALAGVARLMRPRRGGSTLRLQVGVKPIGAGRQPGRKWPMAVAVIALLFVAAAGSVAVFRQPSNEPALPIVPKAEHRQSVRVVTSPYGTTQDTPEAQRPEGGPLPSTLPLAAPVAAQLPSRPAAVSPSGAPAGPRTAEKDARPAAVVLDEGPSVKGSVAPHPPAAAPATTSSGSGSDRAKTQLPSKVVEKAAEKPSALPTVRGGGLVAITPDGRSAVFTDPSTRMPQQFRVGEKLPNGETVRSIAYEKGRVVTTAKEDRPE